MTYSMDFHGCCLSAEQYLRAWPEPIASYGGQYKSRAIYWVIDAHPGSSEPRNLVSVYFCPWCGERLRREVPSE